jgi:hypothetical protein
MHHLLAKFVTVLHVDEEAMRSVGDQLWDEGFDVFVNPGKAEVAKSFVVADRTVVIRPGNVEETQQDSHVAPIEMILVDLLYEMSKLPLMDQSEAEEVAQRVVASARISMGTFTMLAKRRRVDISNAIPTD